MFTRLMRWIERRIDVFAPFNERQTPPAALARFSWHYLRPFRGWLGVIFLSALAVALVESVTILLVGRLVDLLASGDPARLWAEWGAVLLGATIAFLVLRVVLQIVNEAVINQLVPASTNQIRWRTHVYTLGHSLSYFQNDFAGRLANRIIQAGPALREAAVEVLDVVVYVLVYASVTLIAFLTISPWIAAPVAVWLAAYVLMMIRFVPQAQARSLAVSEARSWLTGRVVDSYTNILTVKLFARADTERSAVREALTEHTRAFQASMRLITGTVSTLVVMNNTLLFVTIAIAVWLWSRGAMTPGEVAAALALVMRLNDMSRWFMQILRQIFENVGTVQEAMETIAKPHGLVDRPSAPPLTVRDGAIRFENVTFNYGKGAGVMQNLSLAIQPGEKVGIVGPSGAGKSTLVALLLRLYDVEGGRILVDGQDIAGVAQDSLRESIGVVTQDNSLLHRSIEQNIAYGRPQAARTEIEDAARLAAAHGFIASLKDSEGREGYESRVGERGVKLSGGQRQRIAIARVLLKDAPILILDEATSALDSEIEAAIQESLTQLMQGKTVIAIAHRLSTIAMLDRLVVMDKGRIVEQGSHAELVAAGGLYARLWARQSGGFLGHDAVEEGSAAA
jgi:ATP-binding cassette subfamily B multidrug efflux pump